MYPVGTLCDVKVEDMVENLGMFYVMTLTPKSKVLVNTEENEQMQQFFVNGVTLYESFTSILKPGRSYL